MILYPWSYVSANSMLTFQPFFNTMFSSTGLFKQIQCPEQSHCSLGNCVFSHHVPSKHEDPKDIMAETPLPANSRHGKAEGLRSTFLARNDRHEDIHESDQPRKRRRLSEPSDDKLKIEATVPDGPRRQPLAGLQAEAETHRPSPLSTAVKEVSPPPPRAFKTKAAEYLLAKGKAASKIKSPTEPKLHDSLDSATKASEISLNPRVVHNPPAPHAVRMQLITMLHEEMTRLNEEVWQSQDPVKSSLRLSTQDLILEALEEEEKIAKQHPAVYLNIVKLRITKLKKMKLAEWRGERLKQITNRTPLDQPTRPRTASKDIETGLSTPEEIAFLPKMFAKQDQLTNFGYVPSAPSDKEVAKAREGIEASQGWELCDRCKTRFQVFPGRREEDGALTSGGTCSYHPAKPRRPLAKDKADKGHRDSLYACCNESVGTSIGCTTAPTHVFKVSDPKRLALILPFMETPARPLESGKTKAVCFDCEMGYTTLGLELIRLTATSWPDGKELLDVVVRPMGEILDLNSRFSGVWPKDYIDALPYASNAEANGHDLEATSNPRLRLVESPIIARDLLFALLTPETPLIGHALDNDLNATRMIHPSIVDSVLLYPHPRGLPIRFGLKALMKRHLDRDIQMGGSNGHDSKEDARAAGDLVRLKVADTWRAMQKDGWTVREDRFCPPLPSGFLL